MSSKKVTKGQNNQDAQSRAMWDRAIRDGEAMLGLEKDKDVRHRLRVAIDWLKHRRASGAKYLIEKDISKAA